MFRIPVLIFLGAMCVDAQTAADAIALLKKPGTGNDAAPRLEIRRLTNLSFRPGAEGERQAHEAALLGGLAKPVDWEIKAFLIEELRFCGKAASIDPLAAYLGDADLCEPAAQSLLSIAAAEGAAKAIPAVRTALPNSLGKCRHTLLRAAGSLRDGSAATVAALIEAAGAADRNTRAIGLRGLANIGALAGRPALAKAMDAADALEAMQAASWNLLFAERLAESGSKAAAVEVAQAVRSKGAAASRTNIVTHADSTLAYIQGLPTAIRAGGAPPAGRLVLRRQGKSLGIEFPGQGAYRIRLADARGRVRGEWSGEGDARLSWIPDRNERGACRLVAERQGAQAVSSMILP